MSTASAIVQLRPGAVFAGEFRVLRGLSEGGMGAVYVVEQTSTGKQRALKVMHPQLVHDETLRARFVQEARIGAKIESDHVIDVVAAGIDQATAMPWLAMELLQGETLADRVESMGARHIAEVREVVSQLCHALAAAHRVGIVHRDLKPENIFLGKPRREGVPFVLKVLDFGIAKLVAEAEVRQTAAIGSPLWMAPEQSESGGAIAPASDVWALGLVVFWMLTGKEYWKSAHVESPSAMSILGEMRFEPLVAATARAAEYGVERTLPPGFDGWFAGCVAREPLERFVDGQQARTAFEEMLGTKSAPVKGASQAPTAAQASQNDVPELDLAPRSKSGSRPAVIEPPRTKLPDLELAPQPPRTQSTSRMGAVNPTSKSNPNFPAQNAPISARGGIVPSPAISNVADLDDEFERLGSSTSPMSSPAHLSRPQPIIRERDKTPASAIAPQQTPISARTQTSSVSSAQATPSSSGGIPIWAKLGGAGVVVVGVIYVGLRLLLGATEPKKDGSTGAESKSSTSGAAATAAPKLDCPKGMVTLSGGSYDGSSGKVNVDPFCIDKTEVTVKAYLQCVSTGKCTKAFDVGSWPASKPEVQTLYEKSCNGEKLDKINHPVNCVDATQAQAFCAADDRLLPTEVQWEWAARGKAERWPYPWGKEPPDNHLCWSEFTKRAGTCTVGEYPRGDDPWGVQDLDGNVREWLRGVPGESAREICGSDWTDTRQTFHTLGYCSTGNPSAKSGFLGFRCVKQ